jgi:HMG (high mobility group) box
MEKPKRWKSSFLLFLDEVRPAILSANPLGISAVGIVKLGARLWRRQGDKTKWKDEADVLKRQYYEDMFEYRRWELQQEEAQALMEGLIRRPMRRRLLSPVAPSRAGQSQVNSEESTAEDSHPAVDPTAG